MCARRKPGTCCSTASAPRTSACIPTTGTGTPPAARASALSAAGRLNASACAPYAPMYPGLRTEGVDDAASYVFRGIVADSVRGLEFLLTRREVDATRVVVAGNDIALITAALGPGATYVVTTPALFYRTAELAPKTHGYPLEEINDYLHLHPARAET